MLICHQVTDLVDNLNLTGSLAAKANAFLECYVTDTVYYYCCYYQGLHLGVLHVLSSATCLLDMFAASVLTPRVL